MKKINATLVIMIILLIIGIGANTWLNNINRKKIREKDNFIEALNDSLQTWKDKNGIQNTKIQILETYKLKTFTELSTTNKTLLELQEIVKENSKLLKKRGSATIIRTETKFDTVTNTIVIKDSTGTTYKGSYKDEWLDIESTSNEDSTSYKLKTFSKLSLILGEERQGLFKKSKPYAIVKDENPYTNITDMRTYQVALPKIKRFIIGPSAGYGIMLTPDGVKSGIILGGTVTYNLIKF